MDLEKTDIIDFYVMKMEGIVRLYLTAGHVDG
jgi:hypothetical protein